MNNKCVIVWFRNDLRLHDHQPLMEAISRSESILPVFCFDPRYFVKTKLGHDKTGKYRTKFIIESVKDLRNSFQKLGGNLIVRIGLPEEILPQLAKESGADKVYAFREVASEEIEIADKVENALWKHNATYMEYIGHTMYHKDELPFPIKEIPDVFTNFRKKVERDAKVRPLFKDLEHVSVPSFIEEGKIPTLLDLGFDEVHEEEKSVLKFKGGETEAILRLKHYLWDTNAIATYKETRNGLLGDDFSSKLSPWLSLGCLSPRYVYWELQKYEHERVKNESTYWLFFELLWRDYFRFMFKKYGNKFFQLKGFKTKAPEIEILNQQERFTAWKEGKTGIPFIDANMIELKETGFMSNRGRQNVASFLVKDLKVNWTWGAEYFESMLIDYCPASNWGNWAYIAGVGNDPREDRYFNIPKQSAQYDPEAEYIKHWLPVLVNIPAEMLHKPFAFGLGDFKRYGLNLGTQYPTPIVQNWDEKSLA